MGEGLPQPKVVANLTNRGKVIDAALDAASGVVNNAVDNAKTNAKRLDEGMQYQSTPAEAGKRVVDAVKGELTSKPITADEAATKSAKYAKGRADFEAETKKQGLVKPSLLDRAKKLVGLD